MSDTQAKIDALKERHDGEQADHDEAVKAEESLRQAELARANEAIAKLNKK